MGSSILKAFYVQYVALLLIILSFLIGSVATRSTPKQIIENSYYLEPRLGTYKLPSLTKNTGPNGEESEIVRAIAVVLSQQDVRARVIVAVDGDPATVAWRSALAATLIDLGWRRDAFEIFTSRSISESQIHLMQEQRS